jgi:hypothetical protein
MFAYTRVLTAGSRGTRHTGVIREVAHCCWRPSVTAATVSSSAVTTSRTTSPGSALCCSSICKRGPGGVASAGGADARPDPKDPPGPGVLPGGPVPRDQRGEPGRRRAGAVAARRNGGGTGSAVHSVLSRGGPHGSAGATDGRTTREADDGAGDADGEQRNAAGDLTPGRRVGGPAADAPAHTLLGDTGACGRGMATGVAAGSRAAALSGSGSG